MPSEKIVRFGVFEMDLDTRELRKRGVQVRLQDQPFRVLALLVERPGEIVTREEVKDAIWAEDTFVEFDHGLNTVVQKIREALGDSATNPRFLETVPRRGYRFVSPVAAAAAAPPASQDAETPDHGRDAKRRERILAAGWAATVVLLVAAWIVGVGGGSKTQPEAALRKFEIPVDADLVQHLTISPDGRRIAYMSGGRSPRLFVRDLDRLTPRRLDLDGYLDGYWGGFFWSPGGEFLGLSGRSKVLKIPADGGPTVVLGERSAGGSGDWSPDGGAIVYDSGFPFTQRRLYEISSQGGSPRLLFEPEEDEEGKGFFDPHYLPLESGRRGLLFAVGGVPQDANIGVLDFETGRRTILTQGSTPKYSATGHIVYQRTGNLWGMPFSAATLTAHGEPFPIRERASLASVAKDGTLVYLAQAGMMQLVWRARDGERLGAIGQPQRDIMMPVLSPDGDRVVVRALEDDSYDIWIHEISRKLKRRVTFDEASDDRPGWMPGGARVSY